MYIKDNVLYSHSQISAMLNMSFSDNADLSEYGFLKFEHIPQPAPLDNHKVVGYIENNKQIWEQIPLSDEEIAQRKEELRKEAYQEEADPIFFQWQRGEATQQQWLDKVAEIKARYA